MTSRPKKNLAESVLARAELFRRGMLFEGVPAMGEEPPMLPADPMQQPAQQQPAQQQPAQQQPAPPEGAVPGAATALVAGAVAGESPLETMIQP